MNLIVIEGLDGAGKSTQIQLLRKYLKNEGRVCDYLHFPRHDAPFFGELISKFLRGEFGKLEEVDPYLVAMIYAGDRLDASELLKSWLKMDHIVILDRYVFSNIAYQCAKINKKSERNVLRDWILSLEFNHNNIPEPLLNIFLDVPFSFTETQLLGNRDGADREYLNGSSDIHENSLSFQEKVRNVYLDTALTDKRLEILNCSDKDGSMLKAENISDKIISLLKSRRIL